MSNAPGAAAHGNQLRQAGGASSLLQRLAMYIVISKPKRRSV
jgi:hypothetical protein